MGMSRTQGKRIALVGAAEVNGEDLRSRAFDEVIAVDGGLASLRALGIEPALALGDFDSLGYVPDDLPVRAFPCRKDESDLELALDEACARGAAEIFVYGALSGRLDHTLAAIDAIHRAHERGVRTWGIGDSFALSCVQGAPLAPAPLAFGAFDPGLLDGGDYGRCFSLFAFGGPAQGVRIAGAEYCASGLELLPLASRGLSNEYTGAPLAVSVERGRLTFVTALRALDFAACPPIADGPSTGGRRAV